MKFWVARFLYRYFLRPVLFSLDAEFLHNTFIKIGETLGLSSLGKKLMRLFFLYEDKSLNQKILGIRFSNPILLAAGFDYEARLTQILPEVGFGGVTVGSITWGSYGGNRPPRLGRLPKSHSLLVNKGLKSSGTKNVFTRLKGKKFKIPLGISFAKTNSKNTVDDDNAISDYLKSFSFWEKNMGPGDYYELNISCPNAWGGEPFTTPKRLDKLLSAIDKLNLTKPMFVKMPIELTNSQALELFGVCARHKVSGLIIGNLAKDRKSKAFDKEEIKNAGFGNFSGKPTWDKSNKLIKLAYKNFAERFVIIGCGGVFGAKDAYQKIKLGASLVQMITGMVFEGPQVIGEINLGLARLLKKDGFKSISQAVGLMVEK